MESDGGEASSIYLGLTGYRDWYKLSAVKLVAPHYNSLISTKVWHQSHPKPREILKPLMRFHCTK